MALIVNDLSNIKSISLSDTNGIIRTSNFNFSIIKRSLLKFFSDFQYDEVKKGLNINELSAGSIDVARDIRIDNNGTDVFKVNQNGLLYTQTANIEGTTTTNKLRLKYLTDIGAHGNPGEVVYGYNPATGTLDFWGYVDGLGWLSLTDENGGTPLPPITTDSLPQSVNGVIESKDLPEGGPGAYIIKDDTENDGKIAVWFPEEGKYVYVEPKDGSYTVSNVDGSVYVYDGDKNEWKNLSGDKTIGGDKYEDGLHDFTPDTLISEAVDDFNKDLKYVMDKSLIAFKNVEGKAHTSNDVSLAKENISGGVNVPSTNVFALDIHNMVASIGNGYVKQVSAELVNIPGTNSYKIKYEDGDLKMVSPAFNTGYTTTIMNNGAVMDEEDYVVQYASGVIVFDKDVDITNPKITFYNYEGKTVDDAIISSNSVLYTGDLDMKVSSTTIGDNYMTSLVLTGEPKTNSELMVRINGLGASVGDKVKTKECWFGSAKDGSVKGFSDLEKGDIFYWNGNIAGYDLDENDKVSFSYLVGKAADENPMPEPTPTEDSVKIFCIAAEDIESGSFVHIRSNGTIVTATCGSIENSIEGLFASGFITEDKTSGELCEVYLSGLVGTINRTADTGDYVYLGLDGKFSNTYSDDVDVIQNVGKIVQENGLFVNIEEPIQNENYD